MHSGLVRFVNEQAALLNEHQLCHRADAPSDQVQLDALREQGYVLMEASGDDNNCLIHSLALGMDQNGLLAMPVDRRRAFKAVRQFLVDTPHLAPRLSSGRLAPGLSLNMGVTPPPSSCVCTRLLVGPSMGAWSCPSRASSSSSTLATTGSSRPMSS